MPIADTKETAFEAALGDLARVVEEQRQFVAAEMQRLTALLECGEAL